jgi:hypothetical protein
MRSRRAAALTIVALAGLGTIVGLTLSARHGNSASAGLGTANDDDRPVDQLTGDLIDAAAGAGLVGGGREPEAGQLGVAHHRRHVGIAGFADRVSAQSGDAVRLYVSTGAVSFHVEAYRMGYYGGDGPPGVDVADDTGARSTRVRTHARREHGRVRLLVTVADAHGDRGIRAW